MSALRSDVWRSTPLPTKEGKGGGMRSPPHAEGGGRERPFLAAKVVITLLWRGDHHTTVVVWKSKPHRRVGSLHLLRRRVVTSLPFLVGRQTPPFLGRMATSLLTVEEKVKSLPLVETSAPLLHGGDLPSFTVGAQTPPIRPGLQGTAPGTN